MSRAGIVAVVALTLAFAVALLAIALNARRAQQIQAERAASTLKSCAEQNKRHDDTIRAIDDLIARSQPLSADRRPQSSPGRANTVLIIDALAPHRDCRALVARNVSR